MMLSTRASEALLTNSPFQTATSIHPAPNPTNLTRAGSLFRAHGAETVTRDGGGGLPSPWQTADFGMVAATGSASHTNGRFMVAGSGEDISGIKDGYRYVYQSLDGDHVVVAKVESIENTDPWAKAGVMIRETTDANSAFAGVFVTASAGVSFVRRAKAGESSTHTTKSELLAASWWVKLSRKSNSFKAFYSSTGTNWISLGPSQTITMSPRVTTGIAVSSHQAGTLCRATFSNVTVSPNGAGLTLTHIGQFMDLDGEDALKAYPVRWEGVVVYADPVKGEALLKDDTGAVRVQVDLKAQPLRAGQWVALAGTTSARLVRYPDLPSGSQYLTSFEAPHNIGDYYVARVRGFLRAPRTGEYTFWIASDNESELWLSPDADPLHARRLASVAGNGYYTASREWDKTPSQRSQRITLIAGQSYYIEALHKEDVGEDCLAVAWEGPEMPRAVIQGSYLSPWDGGQGLDSARPAHSPSTGTILREFWLDYQDHTYAVADSFFPWRTNTLPPSTREPSLVVSQVRPLLGRTLPEPHRLSPQQRLGTEKDFQWIETEGIIVSLAEDGSYWSIFELADQGCGLRLQVPNPARKKPLGWLNTRVRVRGFCQGGFNDRGERVADLLWVPSLDEVTLLEPRDEDWARLPAIPLYLLTSTNSPVWAGQRVRVKGRALKQHLRQDLTLSSEVSRFGAFISRDGTNWSQVGEPAEIAMNHSIFAGLAVASRSPAALSTARLDHVSGLSGTGTNTDIGNPPLAGSGSFDGETFTLKGSGGQGRDAGEAHDQFHFWGQPLAGEGEVVARVDSVEETNPFANAGVMMRETLDADAKAVILAISASRSHGAVLRVRRGNGYPNESLFSGQSAPCWVKVARQGSDGLLVRSGQAVRVSPEQSVEAMGVLERTNQSWVLSQAFYRVTPQEPALPPTAPGSPASSIITSAQQIRHLSVEELHNFRSAEIRGVITAKAGDLYVQDGTAGIRLPSARSQLFGKCEVGQYVEVAGRCVLGRYSPILEATRVTVLGEGRMPEAQPKSWVQLTSGTEEDQWVEVRGVVRSIAGRSLNFQMPGGLVSGMLEFDYPAEYAHRLVDATVRLQGVCKVLANEKRQLTGIQLLIPTAAQVAILEPAPEDPFAQYLYPVSGLLKFDPRKELFHRVKVAGVVTCQRGRTLFLQDVTGGMMIEGPSEEGLGRGDRVEVVGFAEAGRFSPVLTEVLIRRVGKDPLPPPARVPLAELLRGNYDAQRVRIEAVLLGRKTEGDHQVLEFLSERRSFRSLLGNDHGGIASVPVGSRVEIKGVFKADPGNSSRTEEGVASFEVYLDSPGDVVLLERPAWWSLKHTLVTVGVLAIVLSGALGWIRMLRRRVGERTLELREEIEEHKRTEVKLATEIDEHKRTEAQLATEIDERKLVHAQLEEKTGLLEAEVQERKRLEVEQDKIHKELLVSSRLSGMAEIATGVLHNVGNVLNSVNVAVNLIANHTRNSSISLLTQVDGLLSEHKDDLADFLTRDAKGRQIPGFVKLLSARLQQERAEVMGEVESLAKNTDHIAEIVAMQQNHARTSGLKEILPLRELVEDAIRIQEEAMVRHGVRLIREFQETPPVHVDKHTVLQILLNLLKNAKSACDADAKPQKCVWIRIEVNGNRARVMVRDNGAGIAPENLIKIFQYGFTTRKDGHGFGLHNCANTAKELGGSLTAHSDGPGQGARFILELPLSAEKKSKTPS